MNMKNILVVMLVFLFASTGLAAIEDKNVDWRSARQFISAVSNDISSTAGITGVNITAEGEYVTTAIPVPRDLDVDQKTYFRVNYTIAGSGANVTGTEEVTWIVTYDQTALGTSLGAVSTALSTTIEADHYTGTTHECWTVTPWGVLNAGTLAENKILSIKSKMNAAKYGAVASLDNDSRIEYLGVELEYTPRRTAGGELDREASRD